MRLPVADHVFPTSSTYLTYMPHTYQDPLWCIRAILGIPGNHLSGRYLDRKSMQHIRPTPLKVAQKGHHSTIIWCPSNTVRGPFRTLLRQLHGPQAWRRSEEPSVGLKRIRNPFPGPLKNPSSYIHLGPERAIRSFGLKGPC